MNKFKIVADSSADILSLDKINFESVPLKIITGDREFTDTPDLNVEEMVHCLAHHKGRSSSSCPNPDEWLKAFGDSEYVFCVPISANISGSSNSASIAKDMYEDKHPDRRVYVVNTLSAGPEMKLIVEKLCELISEGKDFDTVCREIEEYTKKTGLLFLLESVKNFANNGRINPIIAKGIGLLGIRLLGKASDEGQLELLEKCRGADKAYDSILQQLRAHGCNGGKLRITHCFNETGAAKLRDKLLSEYPNADISVYECRGLCSFYAEKHGMLIGYEKN